MQLIVLGMHRSGTSLLARLLNLMGAYFGPEGSSTGANQENPKGFWERRDIRALNDGVLHSIGCDWNRVHDFGIDRLPQQVTADFETRASRLLLGMDAHRPWLMKEPRLCLLLPLWRRVLEVPVCIHIFRHPVEVASSLHKRNGIPVDVGLALWEYYVRASVTASADLPGIVISHRDLMTEPETTVERLRNALQDLGVRGLTTPFRREIESFIEPRLYRERESRPDLRQHGAAPQVTLFGSLISDGLPERLAPHPDAHQLELLARYEATLPPFSATGRLALPEPREQALKKQLSRQKRESEAAVAAMQESFSRRMEDIEARLQEMRAAPPQPRFSQALPSVLRRLLNRR